VSLLVMEITWPQKKMLFHPTSVPVPEQMRFLLQEMLQETASLHK
jgi:hypothetical protein